MKIIFAFLLIILVTPAVAFEDEYVPYSHDYDASKYAPSELTAKEAVINALLTYNWEINEHSRFKIAATYKNDCQVEVSFKSDGIEVAEVENYRCNIFKNSWIDSLGSAYLHYVEVNYHIQKAAVLIVSPKS